MGKNRQSLPRDILCSPLQPLRGKITAGGYFYLFKDRSECEISILTKEMASLP